MPLLSYAKEANAPSKPIYTFVADSNLFMDKPVMAGGINVRAIYDDVRAHPDLRLVIADVNRAEVKAIPSQLQRLADAAPQTTVVKTDVSKILAENQEILSQKFGVEDLILLETARARNLSVVTSNSAMVNQIANNAARYALYGKTSTLIPTKQFKTADELINILQK